MPDVPKGADSKSFDTGNFVSEWFGRRIYPTVKIEDIKGLTGVNKDVCPFLSEVHNVKTECWKGKNSKGVCTISAASNRSEDQKHRIRQDWLVCPHRVIHTDLVRESCARIFGTQAAQHLPFPVSSLRNQKSLDRFKSEVRKNGSSYLFFQDKLGGEISLSPSQRNPEMSFDITLVELLDRPNGQIALGRYGIMEVQTMDFHGTYKGAVDALVSALDLHQAAFPKTLQNNLDWAKRGVEGPNIANVFKRTFYQMLIKFQLSSGNAAAGTVLSLPKSVWDSWQPFLGGPSLSKTNDGHFIIEGAPATNLNSFICVFDIDARGTTSQRVLMNAVNAKEISPIKVEAFIKVDPESLAHFAFTEVPKEIMKNINEGDLILAAIRRRLLSILPELNSTSR